MANLSLYYYEHRWLLDTEKRDVQKAYLFGNLFRFIDDLCAISTKKDHLEFLRSMSTSETSFLDLLIIIENIPFYNASIGSEV